jgi:hypothetical protein
VINSRKSGFSRFLKSEGGYWVPETLLQQSKTRNGHGSGTQIGRMNAISIWRYSLYGRCKNSISDVTWIPHNIEWTLPGNTTIVLLFKMTAGYCEGLDGGPWCSRWPFFLDRIARVLLEVASSVSPTSAFFVQLTCRFASCTRQCVPAFRIRCSGNYVGKSSVLQFKIGMA